MYGPPERSTKYSRIGDSSEVAAARTLQTSDGGMNVRLHAVSMYIRTCTHGPVVHIKVDLDMKVQKNSTRVLVLPRKTIIRVLGILLLACLDVPYRIASSRQTGNRQTVLQLLNWQGNQRQLQLIVERLLKGRYHTTDPPIIISKAEVRSVIGATVRVNNNEPEPGPGPEPEPEPEPGQWAACLPGFISALLLIS